MKVIARTVASTIFLLLLTCGQANATAKDKIVLQFTEDSPDRQTLVLNVAENLKRLYGEDNVEVEVVAFGPGLKLLLANNPNARRIDDLVLKGVRFSACLVTADKIKKKTGKAPDLHPDAVLVKGGILRIIDLVKAGYILVRP